MKRSLTRFFARLVCRIAWPFIGKNRPLPWKNPPPLSEIESAKFLADVEAVANTILARMESEKLKNEQNHRATPVSQDGNSSQAPS
jgi:hypothetical protein